MTEIILNIDALAYGPYGIGRHGGKAVLVPLTAPGDEVEVKLLEEKRSYSVGEVTRLRRPSSSRQAAPCPYFGLCGGCSWQHLRYETQLAAKAKSVDDALRRIGKLDRFDLLPIVPSRREERYRHRVRLHADTAGRTGFYRVSSNQLVEVDSCLIADFRLERALPLVREWRRELATPVAEIEMSLGEDEAALVLIGRSGGGYVPADDRMSALFLQRHPEVDGLILAGRGWRRSWGESRVSLYAEEDLKIRAEGDAFTQVNPEGSRRLLQELLEWGAFHDGDRLLELYSGAGNFTLPIARRCPTLTAVEGSPVAVKSGRENSRIHGLETIRWICSDVPQAVQQLQKTGARFSKIVLNPPRAGAKGLAESLASLGADQIFYISCNPATLARDLAALAVHGYRATRLRPFDFFPHTFHVEVLAEAERVTP